MLSGAFVWQSSDIDLGLLLSSLGCKSHSWSCLLGAGLNCCELEAHTSSTLIISFQCVSVQELYLCNVQDAKCCLQPNVQTDVT